ncbi:MAG TPA: hypothetical protein V6C71_08440 [Coleofasciculaceae cyanobacterium]
MANIGGKEWSYFTSLSLERAIVSYLAHWFCCKNLRQTCSIIKSQFTTRSDELKAAI